MMPEKGAICDKLHLSRTHSESFLRTFWISRANSLNLSCEITEPFLRTQRTFSANSTNFFCGWTEMPSAQRCHSERSLSQRRALAKSMTSLRQLVESKGKLQSIPKLASQKAKKSFTHSTSSGKSMRSVVNKKCFLFYEIELWKMLKIT